MDTTANKKDKDPAFNALTNRPHKDHFKLKEHCQKSQQSGESEGPSAEVMFMLRQYRQTGAIR